MFSVSIQTILLIATLFSFFISDILSSFLMEYQIAIFRQERFVSVANLHFINICKLIFSNDIWLTFFLYPSNLDYMILKLIIKGHVKSEAVYS